MDPEEREPEFVSGVRKKYVDLLEQGLKTIADTSIAPKIGSILDSVQFEETNSWGEPKGKKQTLREFIEAKITKWLGETVDYQGRVKESGCYAGASQTRLAYMVSSHLEREIKEAVTNALKNFNQQLAASLHETVKMKLGEALNNLKVQVNT